MSATADIPNRHFSKPRRKNPRPTLCIGVTGNPGRELGGKRDREPFGPEWLPVAPRRAITTPETALAAAAIEGAICEWLGILAVRLGVRKQLPNGLKPDSPGEVAHAFETADRFIFGEGSMYDFEVCCWALGADPDAVRTAVRAAAALLGGDSRPLGSRKRRRAPKVASLATRAQEARTALVGASS